MNKKRPSEFESAGAAGNAGLGAEFLAMMKQNKKYWLTPIILALLLVGVIVILGASSAAPFIYTLF